MRRRRHLNIAFHASLAACGLALAAVTGGLAASAVADVITTTVAVSTTSTSTTEATTTAPSTTTATTTTAATTVTSPSPPTTTPVTTTSAAPTVPVTDRAFTSGCPVSAVALVLPGQIPDLLGPVTAAPGDAAELDRLQYAVDSPVFDGADVHVSGGGCGSGAVPARVSIASVSLFDGALSADVISLTVGRHDARSIRGLRIGGAHVAASSNRWLPLQRWGEWRIGDGVPVSGGAVVALEVRLLQAHAGLPAGTTVLVAAAGSATRAAASTNGHRRARRHRKRITGRPLRVTPPLTVAHEIFPVVGADAAFVDTYGAFRSDVAGNWHHGDDIFAPLGTPVVAVAGGTINRVGWSRVGGWRLWVRDGGGDEFYYAHLSGYTPGDLRSNRVRAGEVIGFVGNTGDAFTTAPHLHFEVHPRTLLRFGYNGAVDPTGYLQHWRHLGHVDAPKPAHPPLPTQPALRAQARNVWRELLVARHLESRPAVAAASSLPALPRALGERVFAVPALAVPARRPRGAHGISTALLALFVLPAAVLVGFAARRRRSDR